MQRLNRIIRQNQHPITSPDSTKYCPITSPNSTKYHPTKTLIVQNSIQSQALIVQNNIQPKALIIQNSIQSQALILPGYYFSTKRIIKTKTGNNDCEKYYSISHVTNYWLSIYLWCNQLHVMFVYNKCLINKNRLMFSMLEHHVCRIINQ